MGEVSKNMIVILALIVIVVSALGTWAVMNAAINTFAGRRIVVSGSEQTPSGGVVRVSVNDAPQGPITGRVTVFVNDVE